MTATKTARAKRPRDAPRVLGALPGTRTVAALIAAAALALPFAGCLVGPTFQRPPAPTTPGYLPPDENAAANAAQGKGQPGDGATAPGQPGGAAASGQKTAAGVAAATPTPAPGTTGAAPAPPRSGSPASPRAAATPPPGSRGTTSSMAPSNLAPTPVETEQHVALGQQIPARWWELFHSERLNRLVGQAIDANYTLAAARATLAEAQEAIVEARAGLYPQVSAAGSARRGTTAPGGSVGNAFSIGPSVSFSLDAFGGTRRRVEQQTALAENQRYQLAAAYLTLTGGVVSQSITIASVRLQLATVEDLIRNDEKNLDLTQREFNAGKVARTDVLTAAAQLEADRTQLPNLRQQLSVARHALAVLLGRPTADTAAADTDLDIDQLTLPGEVPVSLPSELVRQRPDILAAEADLHADSAAIGVATAQMYPSITLTASLLQEALSLATLFNAAGRDWSAGGSVNQPIYTGGSLSAQKRAAIDAYNAQLAIYQQTVLQAFDQVADSLSALQHDAELLAVAHRAVDIAGDSLRLQRSSYAAGKTSALQLIVSENTYSESRLAYVRAVGQRLSDTAQLFVATGGGWWSAGDLAGGPAAAAPTAAAPPVPAKPASSP